MKLNNSAVSEFSQLWRAYFNAHNQATVELLDLMMTRQDNDWENPMRSVEVRDHLQNWQDAVWGGPHENVFREDAQYYFILDPSPVSTAG